MLGQLRPPLQRRLDPSAYNEVIDMMVDAGRQSCEILGELVYAKAEVLQTEEDAFAARAPTSYVKRNIIPRGFNVRRRCDLFQEEIESYSTMSDTMVTEIKLTQKQMVQNAIDEGYDEQLVMFMKNAARVILASESERGKRTSEGDVKESLMRDMGQWVLNVAVKKAGGAIGGSSKKLTPQQRAALVNLGMKVDADSDIGKDMDKQKSGYMIRTSPQDDVWAEQVVAGWVRLAEERKRKMEQRMRELGEL